MSYSLNDLERYSLIGWCSLTLLLCLLGNTSILVASIKYKAIKLDKITVICIKNIAISDMMTAVIVIIPAITSLITERWVFGATVCATKSVGYILFTGVSILFITTLNMSKLTCLLFPLRARTRSNRTGYVIAVVLWCIIIAAMVLLEIVSFFNDGKHLRGSYDPERFHCLLIASGLLELAFNVMLVIFSGIPMIVMIVSTVWLLVYVKKVRGTLHKETVITLVAISSVFCLTYMPTLATAVWSSLDDNDAYMRFADAILYLNLAVNPLIYFVTIKSYQNFVRQCFSREAPVRRTVATVLSSVSVQPHQAFYLEPNQEPHHEHPDKLFVDC